MWGPDTTVLDVGGGAGKFALPLATRAKHVTVVEPSADSVEMLRSRAAEIGLTNLTVIQSPWVEADAPSADVALCSLVLHHVPDAAPFVSKLQDHATDRVVVVEMMETPGALEIPFYERVHGSAPTRRCPACPTCCGCCGPWTSTPTLRCSPLRRPYWIRTATPPWSSCAVDWASSEGTEADDRFRAAADELLEDTPEGYTVKGVSPRRTAMVTWTPARNGP